MQESDEKTDIESFTEDLGRFGFNAGDFHQWIESDENDPGFQILNDEGIMQTIQDRYSEEQCQDKGDKTEEPRGPTDTEAFNAIKVEMEWVIRQRFRRLHSLTAEKRMSSLKQKSLKNFFSPSQ